MVQKKPDLDRMTEQDWPAVRAIYLEGISTGNATFETEVPDLGTWDGEHLSTCRIVARTGDRVLGWAALSPVSGRCVYAGVAEVSVYVSVASQGKGVGRSLLGELVAQSEIEGIWTLQAGIFPENEASIAIHKICGFRIVGIRERLGKLNGVWRDVIIMERRSPEL
jgi:phosphinothricin acetyltransferase